VDAPVVGILALQGDFAAHATSAASWPPTTSKASISGSSYDPRQSSTSVPAASILGCSPRCWR
jgi:hypothetical protein